MKIYIVINTSLGMSKGKMIAQAGHIIEKVVLNSVIHSPQRYNEYLSTQTVGKVTLKATQKDMENLITCYSEKFKNPVWCCPIYDLGKTQVPTGSLTALAFCPLKEDELPEFIKNAKLL